MNGLLTLLLLPALIAPASQRYLTRPVKTPHQAKAIAEQHTGGLAVSARPVPLNGATGGWEVDVHMPKEQRGWRCIVDRDSHTVFSKTRIANPPRPRSRS